MREKLLQIRGVGEWTADYVLMKCFRIPSVFPITDVGLHNALKIHLGLSQKPSLPEIKKLAADWNPWEAYATFYLWRSLI
jgi:DNA-3-methyladenine glycosylase II